MITILEAIIISFFATIIYVVVKAYYQTYIKK
jgi:hypothetical protein